MGSRKNRKKSASKGSAVPADESANDQISPDVAPDEIEEAVDDPVIGEQAVMATSTAEEVTVDPPAPPPESSASPEAAVEGEEWDAFGASTPQNVAEARHSEDDGGEPADAEAKVKGGPDEEKEESDLVGDSLGLSQVANLGGGSIVGDVLYSIATGEEEGRSRQRILAFAAKRYENAVARNPSDYDALYNWALVLQESADNCAPEAGQETKDRLLEEACNKYNAATSLCPTLHEAFYNWAIAISDRAKIRGRKEDAQGLWKQACEKYEQAVQLNWDSPQALNNWGLALQELGAIVPLREKALIVRKAISKFRAAIRLRFDFHRAVYNLGTVLYGRAEDILRTGRRASVAKEETAAELYGPSALYICTAHALKPDYSVYISALKLVRKMLPLPFLKVGFLTAPPLGGGISPHDTWSKKWFMLDHEALYEKPKEGVLETPRSRATARRPSAVLAEEEEESVSPSIRVDVEHIVSCSICSDLSLPPGGAMCIETTNNPPLYLVAETWEAMDGWVDAIRLVYTIKVRGKQDALIGVLRG